MDTENKRAEEFYSENCSLMGTEAWMTERFLTPIARRISPSVHPNTITVANHLVVWLMFAAAASAPFLPPRFALGARIAAAVLIFVSQTLDCLDGIHARLTGQTSRMGEVLDHWFDSLNVPLFTAALILTLGLDPITTAAGLVCGFAPYHGQLVLYHRTGHFIHPNTSGYDGQFGLMAAFVTFGLLFFFFGFETPWLRTAVTVFAWVGVVVAITAIHFYVVRLKGRMVIPHLWFLIFCGLAAAFYAMGYIQGHAFVFLASVISFRLSGSYVLYTVLGKRYSGVDWSIPLGLLLIGGAGVFERFLVGYEFRGYNLTHALPYAVILWLVGRNLLDLAHGAPELRSSESLPEARE